MSKQIDADLYVEMQIYDEQHEGWGMWSGTIEDLLDQWTEQGCPAPIEVREYADKEQAYMEGYAKGSVEGYFNGRASVEVSEDCISRLEVLELLNAMMAVDSANSKAYAKVFLQVKDAPSVVPKDHNGESTEMVDIDDLIEQADNLIAFEKEMIADTEKG